MEEDVDGVEQRRSGAGKELKGQKKNVIFDMSVYGKACGWLLSMLGTACR